jgi:mannitol-1-phosphate/altronate dehydrogenase
MKKSTLLLFLAAILMTGCAQMNAQNQRAALEREIADARQQCESLMSDTALNPIREKVTLIGAEPTFAMRTNTDHVSAEEKPIIALWAHKRDQCWQIARPTLAKMRVQIVAVDNATKQVVDSMIAELYLGNITYGELANKRAKNAAEYRTTVANIQQALAVQSQQAQFQAQQLANQAIANWNAQMQTQALQQMRRQSNSINCTSNQLGNSTYTNCY